MKKSLFLIVFSFLLFIFGLEIGAMILIKFQRLAPDGIASAYESDIPKREIRDKKSDEDLIFSDIFVPHWFWGHSLTQANNHGFINPEDFPYQKESGEFIIGVFGGSTALDWAEWMRSSEYFSKRDLKQVKVLNFAISAMKQPQQYAVASRFMETLDLAVFYDGFNEAIFNMCPNDPEMTDKFNVIAGAGFTTELKEEIKFNSKLIRLSAHKMRFSWLRNSHFAFYLWRAVTNRLKARIIDLDAQAMGQSKHKARFPECEGDLNEVKFRSWLKYTKLSKNLADFYQIPMIHLLQADPFKPGTKKLTQEEIEVSDWKLHNHKVRGSKGVRTQVFRQHYLQSKPEFSYDFSDIFKDKSQTLYKDPHSHLNPEGLEILSDSFLKILEEKKIFN